MIIDETMHRMGRSQVDDEVRTVYLLEFVKAILAVANVDDASQVSIIGFPMEQVRDAVDRLYVLAHQGAGEYHHE